MAVKTKVFQVFYLILFLSLVLPSCFSSKDTNKQMEDLIFWVGSMKKPCETGLAEMHCLTIHNGDDEVFNSDWELFHDDIEGFEFEFGYFQKVKVREERLDPKDVPADGSFIKYALIDVLDKKRDERIRLYDIWALTHLNDQSIEKDGPRPNMEINLSTMKLMGSDGCNQYVGNIELLTAHEIQVGQLGSTKKLCPDMTVPNQYAKALAGSRTYKLEKLLLFFFNESGNEILRFQKVD